MCAQGKIISIGKPAVEQAITQSLRRNNIVGESMGIADLGCSSGPNALSAITQIMDMVNAECCHLGRSPPEFRLFLNDLFTNDFNNVFVSLPAFYNKLKQDLGVGLGSCFVFGVPGSFYGRLLPSNTLHFVHSSSSLHWLSQVLLWPQILYICFVVPY